MRAFATASRKRENHFEYVSVSLIVMPNIVSYSIRPCQATQHCKRALRTPVATGTPTPSPPVKDQSPVGEATSSSLIQTISNSILHLHLLATPSSTDYQLPPPPAIRRGKPPLLPHNLLRRHLIGHKADDRYPTRTMPLLLQHKGHDRLANATLVF